LDARANHRTSQAVISKILPILKNSIRETDTLGWYSKGVIGAIFTEIGESDPAKSASTLRSKVEKALTDKFGTDVLARISISVHVFPQSWERHDDDWSADSKLYPEFETLSPRKNISRAIKRTMDIVGSAGLLIVLMPLLAVIAVAIKLTSQGPVLFGQERMGQFGKRFKFLKFRSMYVNNAPKIHQEYVRKFISGNEKADEGKSGAAVYKITNDPRVTPIGRFLRKTSLDELPQLWNVLIGEMSLVGPRPPVPYEYEMYQPWHRRRVLEVQPGITGLWQVSGRSRTTFDEMVRLDLRYCRTWSVWLDVKILLATPKAVLFGSGAY
jgi:exopolysaccharide biosynthesis polyprenyl glycosylphosphotransferase